MHVIELTRLESGGSIWINADHIVAFESLQNKQGSRIKTSLVGQDYNVREPLDQIVALMK